jgi:hypothetical protein
MPYLTTFFLAYVSGISSDILSGILSGIFSEILCGWGTLWSGAHGWGPAGNTLIGSLRWRACCWGPAEEGGGGGGPADIKSNKPHLDLTGGEKWNGTSRR